MKSAHRKTRYRVEELVAAAYAAAGKVTPDRALATILVSKILEYWLVHSDRPDLLKQIQSSSW
jgi:hypothetical protein